MIFLFNLWDPPAGRLVAIRCAVLGRPKSQEAFFAAKKFLLSIVAQIGKAEQRDRQA
jgi:hypothetical protein